MSGSQINTLSDIQKVSYYLSSTSNQETCYATAIFKSIKVYLNEVDTYNNVSRNIDVFTDEVNSQTKKHYKTSCRFHTFSISSWLKKSF